MEANNQQGDQDFHNYLTGNNEELISLIQSWRSDFINLGGFDHLVQIYHTYKTKEYNSYTIFDKKILGFVLNILRNYLMASFSIEIDGLYQQVQLARRINLNLDFLKSYLKDPELPILEMERIGSKVASEKDDDDLYYDSDSSTNFGFLD
jgi:hypothetical protein